MVYGHNYKESEHYFSRLVYELFERGLKVSIRDGKVIATTPKGKDIEVDIEKTSKFRAWLMRESSMMGRSYGLVIVTEAVNHVIEAEIIAMAVEE